MCRYACNHAPVLPLILFYRRHYPRPRQPVLPVGGPAVWSRCGPAQWRGLFTGFLLISLVSVAITWRLGAALGQYVGMLSWLGAVYMLWLAWHIARSPKSGAAKDPAAPTFRTGLLINLTNVKIMIFCLTALSAYVLPYTRSFWALLGVGLFLPFTGRSATWYGSLLGPPCSPCSPATAGR